MRVSEQFPNNEPWPVKPPDDHWLKRWHWLRTEDGDLHLASWAYQFGWHFDWSGKPDPEDMTGWQYVDTVSEPTKGEWPRAPKTFRSKHEKTALLRSVLAERTRKMTDHKHAGLDFRHARPGAVVTTHAGDLTIERVEHKDHRTTIWFVGFPNDPHTYLWDGRQYPNCRCVLDILSIMSPSMTEAEMRVVLAQVEKIARASWAEYGSLAMGEIIKLIERKGNAEGRAKP